MKLKRIIASILSATLLAGLLVCPASAAGSSSFTDVTDETVAEAVEILHALGVVNGTGNGQFQPDRTLTRAEFCKMAIVIMGRGEEAQRQSGRVIFSDVRGDHWARGYINAAAMKPSADEPPLVAGIGNGLFQPDANITYGAAAAILLRALGYSDQDVGMGLRWYDGYVSMAQTVGLSDGLSVSGEADITRGQAAILFRNLLFTPLKGSDTPYLTKLGASEEESAIILSVDAVADDGSTGAVRTQKGTYRTDRAPFPSSYEGVRGKVVLDKTGKVLAIRPDGTGSDKTVSVANAQATYVKAAGGEKLSVDGARVLVYSAAGDPVPYQEMWVDLRVGTQLTFHYSPAGELEYIYLRGGSEGDAVVATGPGTAQFSGLIPSGADYVIYKNGAAASATDICQYDVATYDRAAKALQLSDRKVTGEYENASPNTTTPTRITVMGQSFDVLPGAVNDLAQFKLGQTVTLLLTLDGRVAGAVSPAKARSTIIGLVLEESTPDKLVVEAVNLPGFTFSGKTSRSEAGVEQLKGQLVQLGTGTSGYLSVAALTSAGTVSPWNVQAGTIGGARVADHVKIFEKVGIGALYAIDPEDITVDTVPASKLLYVGKDYAGRVDLLVVDDVTGDGYTYGFLSTGTEQTDSFNGEPVYNATVTVSTDGDSLTLVGGVSAVQEGAPGGIAASLNALNGMPKVARSVLLECVEHIPRSAFEVRDGRTVVTFQGTAWPVADGVVCYNAVTEQWFESLAEARAFSDDLTVYYDKAPEDGGKIRMVVAE